MQNLSAKATEKKLLSHFNQVAREYDAHAFFQREVGERLMDRLDMIKLRPTTVLDLGGGTGYMANLLSERFPEALVVNCDFAEQMLRMARKNSNDNQNVKNDLMTAKAEMLPFKTSSVDIVFSNLHLDWVLKPMPVLSEIKRVLTPEGVMVFSSLGQNTLKELKTCFAKIDDKKHVNQFYDMHDLGDGLLKLGFIQPVIASETLTIEYLKLDDLILDLRKTGSHFVFNEGKQGLRGSKIYKALKGHYEEYRNNQGNLPVTIEVIYGQAWGSHEKDFPENARTIKIQQIVS